MNRLIALCLITCLLSGFTIKDDAAHIPSNQLFYIKRSVNRNIVCYEPNITPDGKLDIKEPLLIYWINREEHPGKRGELSFFQREMAFGYKLDKSEDVISLKINAFKQRSIIIEQDEKKAYFCITDINGQPSFLQSIYVKTQTKNSLQVEFIELSGICRLSGEHLTERVYNK